MSISFSSVIPSTPTGTAKEHVLTTPPHTPAKNYPLCTSPGGRIHVEITPLGKKRLSRCAAIYRFKNIVTGERYAGASQQPARRVNSHTYTFRHPARTNSPLAKAVSRHPYRFVFGVIEFKERGVDLDEAERRVIQKTDSIRTGFNRRNGGGGGTSHAVSKVSKAIFDSAYKKFSTRFTDPTQYPFQKREGRIHISLPDEVRSKTSVIYDFIERTPNGPIHYPGYTSGKLSKRIGEHICEATNPKNGDKRGGFYTALARDPTKFSLAVHNTDDLGVPIQICEQIVIRYYREHKIKLRNQNGGGGGGVMKS